MGNKTLFRALCILNEIFSVVLCVVFSAKYEKNVVCYYLSLADYNITFQPWNIKFSNVLAQSSTRIQWVFE